MTQNKVQKAAIRRRMAETGESYVVARRIVLDDAAGAQGVRGAAGGLGLTPEQQYALEAEAAGASRLEIDSQTLVYRLEAAAERALEAAERAREQADAAEDEAEQTEDLAGQAEEAVEEAEEWAEPAEKRLLRERAAQLQAAAERARLAAEQAEEAAVAAEERAELAADAADEAADGEFPEPVDDDPASVWAEATGDGFTRAHRAGFTRAGGGATWAKDSFGRASEAGAWAEDEGFVPPVPPAPPVPPVPPVPPAPPVSPW